jgi:hypothetical protein
MAATPAEAMRAEFETFFRDSRAGKGANKPDLTRLRDGDYYDSSTQRHWWTWQQSRAAPSARLLPPPTVSNVVMASWQSESRPPCAVCSTPAEKHGSYPDCATHPYTRDNTCQYVIGARCAGAGCVNGCVHATKAKE